MADRNSETDDILAEAKKAFQQCVDAEADNRETALEDLRFVREGIHWPENVRKQREAEGRPCLTIPKLPAFVRQVVNDARQNKPQIKVRPVDSNADVETAEVISGLIRNIEYASSADVAYDTATECAVTGGFGYIRVGLDYAYEDAFEMDIQILRVANPFSIYGDPNSRAADSSDWDVAFATDRLSKAQYEREYGKTKEGEERAKVDWDDDAWSGEGDIDWINEDGCLVAEWWTREKEDTETVLLRDLRPGSNGAVTVVRKKDLDEDEDLRMPLEMGLAEIVDVRTTKTCKVTQRKLSGIEVLETREWPGRFIPIVPVYGEEFDIEGKRFFRSLVHNAIDAQRMFNYWRTASTELVALAPKVPYIGAKGSFDSDAERWNSANTKSHPFLEYDPVGNQPGPQRQQLDMGVAAGALQEALNASDDMKAIIGIYDAGLGARSNETSGKAILARQRESDVSTFHFQDNMARAIRHVGRIVVDLIPHVYNTPRIIRVIGEDGSQADQPINQQAPKRDKKGNPVLDKTGQAIMALHDLTVGKYDITVSTGPSFTTRREEVAAQMTEMIRALPATAPILGKHLAKNLDWPGADEIADELEALTKNQIPEPLKKAMEEGKQLIQKQEQEIQQLKMDRTAEMAKVQSDAQISAAQMDADNQAAMAKVASERELAMIRIQNEREIAMAKIAAEREIAMEKARLAAETAVVTSEIKADASAEAAKTAAAARPKVNGGARGSPAGGGA